MMKEFVLQKSLLGWLGGSPMESAGLGASAHWKVLELLRADRLTSPVCHAVSQFCSSGNVHDVHNVHNRRPFTQLLLPSTVASFHTMRSRRMLGELSPRLSGQTLGVVTAHT